MITSEQIEYGFLLSKLWIPKYHQTIVMNNDTKFGSFDGDSICAMG